MSTRDKILVEARRKREIRTRELVEKLGISRQSVAAQLKSLVDSGVLSRSGSTRSACYRLASQARKKTVVELSLIKKTKGLEEDRVFLEADRKLGLSRELNRNAFSILSYAFTEMLNNAIDHSGSETASARFWMEKGNIQFEVRDFGIGIFRKVSRDFRLENEFEGMEHVLKGKQTSQPSAHSGEGIFFTSRIADVFTLRSHHLQVRIDNRVSDTFVSEPKKIVGTSVQFSISINTKKHLSKLFAKHTNADFMFDRADQRLKVAAFGGALSRSQAKRLLQGLESFDRLTFDFKGVTEIGQGFADEVFRIYSQANPKKQLDYTNASPAIELMIQRARKSAKKVSL